MGQWLGQLTLARNKPIILTYLNLKTLLQEAYETGQNKLEKVLPLVCKILEPSKDSQVFNYKNPWLSAVLGLLQEIAQNNIKMSLKCEI